MKMRYSGPFSWVADKIHALARIKADLSQLQLADLMGVSQAYISKLESKQKVPPKTLPKVMQLIDEHLKDIQTNISNKKQPNNKR